MAIFSRFPKWGQIAPVYSVSVLMIYTWTVLWFFWKLPSWLDFLDAGEIASVFTFALATNFVESLFVLCAPILLSMILPKGWFYDCFVARGSSLIILGLSYMMYVAFQFQTKDGYPSISLKIWWLVLVMGVILFFVYLIGRTNVLRNTVERIADRTTIFLYISIPLSIISLMVVLIRSVA